MTRDNPFEKELFSLQERLARMTEASLRINESLEFDIVLNEVADTAGTLADARHAASPSSTSRDSFRPNSPAGVGVA